MAYGNVYVFNLYSAAADKFTLNGVGSAGEIAAPAKSGTTPWAPPQLAVPRTNLNPDQLNDPMFCTGDNTVRINYGGQNFSGIVTVPGQPDSPLENDLWLYLAHGQGLLFLPTGQLKGTFTFS